MPIKSWHFLSLRMSYLRVDAFTSRPAPRRARAYEPVHGDDRLRPRPHHASRPFRARSLLQSRMRRPSQQA